MYDRKLIETGIEGLRRLVRILETGGTDTQALGRTAEILEVAAKVMTHHRLAIPPEARQAWAQVSQPPGQPDWRSPRRSVGSRGPRPPSRSTCST